MNPEQLETLKAAIRVKLGLHCDVPALIRGLPKRHAVEWSTTETADFILRQFACNESETQLLTRPKFQIGNE